METQNIVTNEQVFEKLCAIEELLLTPQIEKGLWSIKDVANYMDLSYGHVYENIVTDPRFQPLWIFLEKMELSPKSYT